MLSRQASLQVSHAAPVFAALGDDIRLFLVARLSGGKPLSITRLSEGMSITRQAVTKHLHVLENAGIAKSSKSGREQMWELKPESFREAQRCLEIITKQWGQALNRLKAFVEDEK
jgi:DNA-binding transcriptional ArsR family regulator